jgi:hypothetical protein
LEILQRFSEFLEIIYRRGSPKQRPDKADRAADYISLSLFARRGVLADFVGWDATYYSAIASDPNLQCRKPWGASAVSAGALGHDLRLGATQAK